MWERLLNWAKFVWDSGAKLESTATKTDRNTELIVQFSEAMRRLVLEQNYRDQMHAQEMAALKEKLLDEIEKLELRLRLEIERNRPLSPRDDKKELS